MFSPAAHISDACSNAVLDAKAVIAETPAGATLVDKMPADFWSGYDASTEMALVADKDGIE